MDYFFYCRDNPDTFKLRLQVNENHQSFMDKYTERMIARGPTLADDRASATGSIHILDLPDISAAETFAYDEPNYKAGVYGEVIVRRWCNYLNRTMWEFKGNSGNDRYAVICHGNLDEVPEHLSEKYSAFVSSWNSLGAVIVCGTLFSDDDSAWKGHVMMVEVPRRTDIDSMLSDDPYNQSGLYESIEIHPWRFGGRI